MRRLRCNHTVAFKAKVLLAAIQGEQPIDALAQQFNVHADPIDQWKAELLKGATLQMKKGFLYLVAVIDWNTHKVLAHRLSSTMYADFCFEALNEAVIKYGQPEIMNTDQGSQFTSFEFIQTLRDYGIQISMECGGCWRDNVLIERFWRTIKYQEVYMRTYETTSEARGYLGRYIDFYNQQRPHASLGG